MSGLPLLSHPPPDNSQDTHACRKCNKDFNMFFNRQKRCNHCGYAYCSGCADFQALMPRTGADRGYEALPVCSFCMEMLTITASSKNRLRGLPLSTLRSYMKAYDIRMSGAALEKDDLVEAILRAKGSNGCLLPAHEDYYRKHSVPLKSGERPRSRNIFSRNRQEASAPTPQPQQRQHHPSPDTAPPHGRGAPQQYQFQPQHRPEAPGPTSQPQHRQHYPISPHARAAPPQYQHHPQSRPEAPSPQRPLSRQRSPHHNATATSQSSWPHSSRSSASSNNLRPSASQSNFHSPPPRVYPMGNQHHPRQPQPRPRSAAPAVPPTRPPAPPAPPPPVPNLNTLLQMTSDDIAHCSISTLKSILFENRVNTSFGVLEKQDLVQKVVSLVTDERRDREIKEREEREEAERMEWARREREKGEEERKATERDRKLMEGRLQDRIRIDEEAREQGKVIASTDDLNSGSKPVSLPSPSAYPFSDKTQGGLCVICQDEHANMAIIDCGHLALCKGCSETVMKTTRECPLCRTRIVTEQRLLRIFKS